ncbi:MAG: iniA, partial [Deltaproteobacteria bacterium]|nr:iniA [Deltaproteobacteria bacterium]
MRILTPKQEVLLKDERRILNDLRAVFVRLGAQPEDEESLKQSIQQLDELFLIVVVGEFNSGKSLVINALLGESLLEEGVTPTTTQLQILRYGQTREKTRLDDRQVVLTSPVEFLTELCIVDTPGTNAILREHETITSQFVPRSDLVLFVTSAERPFTESERVFLEYIREWGKKVVFVVNKIDILQNEKELNQVVSFVQENAGHCMGSTPVIFPVSARMALREKLDESFCGPDSRFKTLEQYIHQKLDEQNRLRLKLLNPLGVGTYLIKKYREITASRMEFLKSDITLLADLESQLALYEKDMEHNFKFRMAEIENILFDMEGRGRAFFDETFRLARIFELLNKARIQRDFEHRVVADMPQRLEKKAVELIHWLVDCNLSQWQTVVARLSERRQEHKERILGDIEPGSFRQDRDRLIETIGRETSQVVERYDKNREARTIAENAQTTIAASAAMEAGAVGLGALVTAIATTAAADVTGILMAGVIAALGLFIIPARRRQGQTKMLKKISDLREGLTQSLR